MGNDDQALFPGAENLPYGSPFGPGGFFGTYGRYEHLPQIVEDLIEEAIEADMAHRDYRSLGDGAFVRRGIATIAVRWNGTTLEVGAPRGLGDNAEFEAGDPDTTPILYEKELEELASEVFGYYPDRIRSAFEKFYGLPDPSSFDGMLDSLIQGAARISTVAGTTHPLAGESNYDPGAYGNTTLSAALTNLITRTGQMQGQSAKKFAENYVAFLPGILGNDHLVCTSLAIALSSEKHVMGFLRDDVTDIANKGKSAMRHSGPEESSTDGLLVTLTILGAIASGVAAVATGGTSLAVTAGLTAAGATGAAGILSGVGGSVPRKDVELGASHPKSVLSKVEDALHDLDQGAFSQEQSIQTLLDDVNAATQVPNQFDLSRPHLLDVRRANLIIKEDEVFITPSDIVNITERWMPEIADALRGARKCLVASSLPFERNEQVGLGTLGPWFAYERLEERLAVILVETSGELDQGAHHMKIATRHIGVADDAANAALGRHSDKLDRLLAKQAEDSVHPANPMPYMGRPGGPRIP